MALLADPDAVAEETAAARMKTARQVGEVSEQAATVDQALSVAEAAAGQAANDRR